MPHRTFIAVNLPEKIKRKLAEYEDKWLDLPVRWTKKENLHITLVFLGYLNDQELLETINLAESVASENEPFSINLNKIVYGPPKKMPPRMVWTEGQESQELADLQNDLENSLFGGNEKKVKPFSPHITLGRMKTWEFRKLNPEERPDINEQISFNFEVNSIEVMESRLKRGGPEYIVLESCLLKK